MKGGSGRANSKRRRENMTESGRDIALAVDKPRARAARPGKDCSETSLNRRPFPHPGDRAVRTSHHQNLPLDLGQQRTEVSQRLDAPVRSNAGSTAAGLAIVRSSLRRTASRSSGKGCLGHWVVTLPRRWRRGDNAFTLLPRRADARVRRKHAGRLMRQRHACATRYGIRSTQAPGQTGPAKFRLRPCAAVDRRDFGLPRSFR